MPGGVSVAASDCFLWAWNFITRGILRPECSPVAGLMRFPKSARLTRSSEFRRVKEQGRSYHGALMVLNVAPVVESQQTRIGLVTSRRVGNAVQRNRARRRLRELARESRMKKGLWIVVIAKKNAATAPWPTLKAEWLQLCARASIFEEAK